MFIINKLKDITINNKSFHTCDIDNIEFICIKDRIGRRHNYIETIIKIICLSSFPCVLIPDANEILNYECMLPVSKRIMKGFQNKIKKLIVYDPNYLSRVFAKDINSETTLMLLKEYKVDPNAYMFFKFIQNTGLINSLNSIEFNQWTDINYNYLLEKINQFRTISEKSKISIKIFNDFNSFTKFNCLVIDLIFKNPSLMFRKKENSKLLWKYLYAHENKVPDDYSKDINYKIEEKELEMFNHLSDINLLLLLGIAYKCDLFFFLKKFWVAEVTKIDSSILKCEICPIKGYNDNDCMVIDFIIPEIKQEFSCYISNEDIEIKNTEELMNKLKTCGFNISISIETKEGVLTKLCVLYLEVLLFPLCISIINAESKVDK